MTALALAAPARRAGVLSVAKEMFAAQPFDEVSMDGVADRASVAKGLIYYYFGSKRGLYVETVRAAAAELRREWDTDAGGSPMQQLRAGIDAYLGYAERHPAGYRSLMAGGVGTDGDVRAVLDAERAAVIDRVVSSLGLSERRPALRAALQGWLSFMEGVTLDWLAASDLSRDDTRELVLGALRGALAAAHGVDPAVPSTVPVAEPT